jgi:DNA primase
MNAHELTEALGGRWHGRYGAARCPAHDDRGPSLSICDGRDGKVLVKCFGGCQQRDVINALQRAGQ